jgi:hypothetical protein
MTAKTDTEWVLWGFHPAYCGGTPIRLTGGTQRHCRSEQKPRTAEGFTCAIYKQGTAPAGLREQAKQARASMRCAHVRALLAELQPKLAAALEAAVNVS